jgi:hypothetical protein
MLSTLDVLEKGFQEIAKKSKEDCGDKLTEMRQLIFIIQSFNTSLFKCAAPDGKKIQKKYSNSLAFWCHVELVRASGHILWLSMNALYRNAFDNIRHVLESVVQALYIDSRHPDAPIPMKIEILKEVEDKREYHAIRLVDELEIPPPYGSSKSVLKKEYRKLSGKIHPSHEEIVATLTETADTGIPAKMDCEEVTRIFSAMKTMYDIFYFLYIVHFPELGKALKENTDFIRFVESYDLSLLSDILKN